MCRIHKQGDPRQIKALLVQATGETELPLLHEHVLQRLRAAAGPVPPAGAERLADVGDAPDARAAQPAGGDLRLPVVWGRGRRRTRRPWWRRRCSTRHRSQDRRRGLFPLSADRAGLQVRRRGRHEAVHVQGEEENI